MCDPVTLGLTLTGAQTAAGLVSAKRQSDYQEDVFDRTRQNANANAIRSYQALQERQQQERAAAAEAIAKNTRAVTEASGSLRVSAGESGVAGGSIATLLQDFEATALGYEHTVSRNQAFLDSQFRREALGVQRAQEAEINRAIPEPPNYLGVLLSGATSALKIYGKNQAQQP